MYTMLSDSHPAAAKKSLDVMIELFKKGVWEDAKTTNVIASALTSEDAKLRATAHRFFLLAEEDKQSAASVQYWFHILDYDGDGVIDTNDMRYFYEEQQRRLEAMGEEVVLRVAAMAVVVEETVAEEERRKIVLME